MLIKLNLLKVLNKDSKLW